MLKNERAFTTTYTGGAPNGLAILHKDGSLTVQPDRGQKLVIEGLAQAVLEENAAYLEWREAQGGTPGAKPEDVNAAIKADELAQETARHVLVGTIEMPDMLDESGEHPSTGLGNDDEMPDGG